MAASFDPSDHRILTAALFGDHEVRLWSREGALFARLPHPIESNINHAVFSKDGAWIFTATTEGIIRVWDVSEPSHMGQELLKWQAHADWVTHMALSADGHYLLSADPAGHVAQWPISLEKIVRQARSRLPKAADSAGPAAAPSR